MFGWEQIELHGRLRFRIGAQVFYQFLWRSPFVSFLFGF